MDTTLLIWMCIAAAALLAVSIRIAGELRHRSPRRHNIKFIELGSETEELFVPGDKTIKNLNDYNDTDD